MTGHWAGEITTPDGGKRNISFYFQQNGNDLTGYVQNFNGSVQKMDVAGVHGNTATWVVVTEGRNGVRKMEYSGTIAGNEMRVMMPSFGNRPPTEVVVRKVSSDPTVVSPYANLQKPALPAVHSLPDNGLARTPPMGWNSWNHFHGQVSDAIVREVADAIASNGMKDAGYTFINIDDTWEGTRDANGVLGTNKKFPDMKALADYVHSKGLKIGIYSSPGPRTCAGFEGSYGHEQQDAKTWASWGIDYLKYDWCSAGAVWKDSDMQPVYQIMGDALEHSGRKIVFSLCQYGRDRVETWGPSVAGNLWRTTGDIGDNWDSMSHIGFDQQNELTKYAGPGHWNDPDMLEVGNGGMTTDEYKTHMSLWAMLAAPLLAGNDVRHMDQTTHDILCNRDVIAIDQDKAGHQGYRASQQGTSEVWVKPLENGDWAVALFNRGTSPATIAADWSAIKMSGSHQVRDLWTHEDRGAVADRFSSEVPPHGVVLVRVSK